MSNDIDREWVEFHRVMSGGKPRRLRRVIAECAYWVIFAGAAAVLLWGAYRVGAWVAR